MLLLILLVLLAVSLFGGTYGYSRYGYVGWSPAGVILLILFVLWFTGHMRFG